VTDKAILNSEFLKNRLKELNWTVYRLAQEVANVRKEQYGEEFEDPRTLISSIQRAINNPNSITSKNLEVIVLAMGGRLSVKWTKEKTVVVQEEVEEELSDED
jgi:hypothetical protein